MDLINCLKLLYHRTLFFINPSRSKVFQWIPFDIKKPLPNCAFEEMVVVLNKLSSCDVHLRPSDGTLLGILREGKLIKHDNDLDFDVIHSNASVKAIRKLFSTKRYKKCREVLYQGKVQQLTYYDSNHVLYDFIFWFVDGKFGVNFSEPGYLRIMPRKFIFDLTYVEIDNNRLPVPINSIEWLDYRYGEFWATPHEEKGDWKQDCGDLVKLWD